MIDYSKLNNLSKGPMVGYRVSNYDP